MQEAIEKGDLRAIQSLLKQGSFVELPLHASVRSSGYPTNQDKIEAVKLFLRSGARLEEKDKHGLTALDHAIHLNDVPLVKEMISEKIGIASEIIKNQIEIKRSSDSLSEMNERLQQKRAVNPTALGALQKAAYEGNLEELKKAKGIGKSGLSTQLLLDQLDKQGLALIHYAVLGNKRIRG